MSDGIVFTSDEEHSAYRMMVEIRRFEEKVGLLCALGTVEEDLPLSVGQEAAVLGAVMATAPDDILLVNARCHAQLLARGTPAEQLFRAIKHPTPAADPNLPPEPDYHGQDFGAHGPYHSQYELLSDAVTRAKVASNTASTVFAFVGAGEETGDAIREALAAAREDQLPLAIVVENNITDVTDTAPLTDVASTPLAETLADILPVTRGDGIDVRKARHSVEQAVTAIRGGGAPHVIELRSYAYSAHGSSASRASSTKRPREVYDPLAMARARLIQSGQATEKDLKALEKSVREEINRAAAAAT